MAIVQRTLIRILLSLESGDGKVEVKVHQSGETCSRCRAPTSLSSHVVRIKIINTLNDLNLTHTLQPLLAISHKRSFIRHELYYESPHTNGFYYLYKVPL